MAESANYKAPKHRKYPVYFIIFAIVIGSAVLIWQFYKYKIVNKGISNKVSSKSKGLYSMHYEDLVIDEIGGSLRVKNVRVFSDSVVFNKMVADKSNPSLLVKLTIPSMELLGVRTPKALIKKQVVGRIIKMESPTIEIELNDFLKDTTAYHFGKETYKEILGNLLSISIDSIEVTHANIIVRNRGATGNLFMGKDVSIAFTDILIDSLHGDDPSRILFARNVEMNCSELELAAKSNEYKLKILQLQFLSRTNSFSIGQFMLQPQLPEEAFATHAKVQKDRYDFLLQGIRLLHFDRDNLWHKRIIADELVITKSSFKIYRDLSHPRDTLSRVGKYPQQELMHLPIAILIRKISLPQSFIEYKEKNAKSNSSGKVQFYHVKATIDNTTNIKSAIAANNKCVVHFNASLLQKIPIHANLVMILKDPKGRFSISGSLGSFDAPVLNSLTQPMGLAKIEKGHVTGVRFDLSGSDSVSDGKVTFLYKDLKIALVKRDEKNMDYKKKFLPSLAAGILIKGSNPGPDGNARTADAHYDRNIHKSFFNLIWKSIFTGVKKTVGM